MRVLPQSWHVAGGMGICQRITCYAPTSSSGVMTGLSEAEERQQELNFLTRHQLMARGELEGEGLGEPARMFADLCLNSKSTT